MADRLKRASMARVVVVIAALAFPLLAVGTAQAAIAGGNPEATTNRPDLVSATALDSANVDFCFDKVLNNAGLNPTNFLLGGYRSGRSVTASAAGLELTFDTTGRCVRATFDTTGDTSDIGDIGQYTIGTVRAGAVAQLTGTQNTFDDSTALTMPASLSPTNNGTAGFTTGPDLVTVLPDPTTNTITYTEDQAINTTRPVPTPPVAGLFYFLRPGGLACPGISVLSASGTSITVYFGLPAICPVTDAARAGQKVGAIPGGSAADPAPAGAPSTPDSRIVPASLTSTGTGTTALPDLTNVVLDTTGGGALNFTFDKAVAVSSATGFQAILSDGTVVPSLTAVVTAISTTSTTVRATFTNLSLYDEYVVKGGVVPSTVIETSAPNNPNYFDTEPAGDNKGAFARGFTTGPDAFSGIINTTTGVLTLNVDQRVFASAPGQIDLLDSTGNSVATASAGSVGFPSQAAGPETITVQFSPGQATTAANVSLKAGALFTNQLGAAPIANAPGLTSQGNVVQILSIPSTASILRAERLAKPQSRRSVAASRARTRAREKALLAKLMHRVQRQHKHL